MAHYRRDVSAAVQFFRTLLLGRTWNQQNRFQEDLAPRPYPKPDLTGGVAHKASDNYYLSRDGRRQVQPAQDISLKQLEGGQASSANRQPPTPGPAYKWD